MPSRASLKSELRERMRQWRRQLTSEQQSNTAHTLAEQCVLLPAWAAAKRIGLYLANDGEVITDLLAARVRAAGKVPYLPVLEYKQLRFAQWREGAELVPNQYGIGEPDETVARRSASELDVLCLPLVAWDRSGTRLGLGAGYYDRTLAQAPRPLLVGLGHSGREVDELPRDEWDITLDWIVTERDCHRC